MGTHPFGPTVFMTSWRPKFLQRTVVCGLVLLLTILGAVWSIDCADATEVSASQKPTSRRQRLSQFLKGSSSRSLQAINPNQLSPMATGVPVRATPLNDRGRIPDTLVLEHILLLLHRPLAQEQALQDFMREQQDPNSPNYRNWLTAGQF